MHQYFYDIWFGSLTFCYSKESLVLDPPFDKLRWISPFWAGVDGETAKRVRNPEFRRLHAAPNSEANKRRLSNGEVSLTMGRFSNDVAFL